MNSQRLSLILIEDVGLQVLGLSDPRPSADLIRYPPPPFIPPIGGDHTVNIPRTATAIEFKLTTGLKIEKETLSQEQENQKLEKLG